MGREGSDEEEEGVSSWPCKTGTSLAATVLRVGGEVNNLGAGSSSPAASNAASTFANCSSKLSGLLVPTGEDEDDTGEESSPRSPAVVTVAVAIAVAAKNPESFAFEQPPIEES
jgi:hypothetical protein